MIFGHSTEREADCNLFTVVIDLLAQAMFFNNVEVINNIKSIVLGFYPRSLD